MEREIKVGSIYKHFKGHIYKVIAIAYDSENYNEEDPELSKMVVYQNMEDEKSCWVRPYQMFNSLVDKEKYPDINQEYRFEEVRQKVDIEDFSKESINLDTASMFSNNQSHGNIDIFEDVIKTIDNGWSNIPDAGLLDSHLNKDKSGGFTVKKSKKM